MERTKKTEIVFETRRRLSLKRASTRVVKTVHLATGRNEALVWILSSDAAYQELMSDADTHTESEDLPNAKTK